MAQRVSANFLKKKSSYYDILRSKKRKYYKDEVEQVVSHWLDIANDNKSKSQH